MPVTWDENALRLGILLCAGAACVLGWSLRRLRQVDASRFRSLEGLFPVRGRWLQHLLVTLAACLLAASLFFLGVFSLTWLVWFRLAHLPMR